MAKECCPAAMDKIKFNGSLALKSGLKITCLLHSYPFLRLREDWLVRSLAGSTFGEVRLMSLSLHMTGPHPFELPPPCMWANNTQAWTGMT